MNVNYFLIVILAIVGLVLSNVSQAQDNVERLRNFQTTGTPLEIPTVDQYSESRAAIERSLEKINLPEGFSISLYALVPDARHMAVGNNLGVVFVGTRKPKVYVVTDRDRDGIADEVKIYAPSIEFSVPNGVCMSRDGFLYVIETNRVLVFPAAEFFYETPDVAVDIVVPQGELIPVSEESFNHGARVCRIGPDNKLYIALGQPYNVPPKSKRELYKSIGMGGIIRMNRDGSDREVYAYGIRYSSGMDFNPNNNHLWFTDSNVDGMGDDIPPGELNRSTKIGQHFGFPWYVGYTRTYEYADETPPDDVIFPEVITIAHAADLGMTFLYWSDVSRKVSRRDLQCAARLLESDGSCRSSRDVYRG